jgi:uncharacterized protein (DUF4213/DUF364 family)
MMDVNGNTGDGSPCSRILDEAASVLRRLYDDELDTLLVERLVVGVFFVGIKLSNGCGGVAYTPPEVVKMAGRRILKGHSPLIRGQPVTALINGAIAHPFAGVIRLAALNALSVPFFKSHRYSIGNDDDLSGIPAIFHRRRVCIVGAIIPLLKRLKDLGATEVTIIDRKQETQAEAEVGYGTFVRPEHTAEALSRCQTAIFTGAAIANGTITQLIDWAPADAAIAVVGPTAGFVPEPLFRRGVALIGTSVVTDSDQALEILAEGGGGYRLFGACVRKINLLNEERLRQRGLNHGLSNQKG